MMNRLKPIAGVALLAALLIGHAPIADAQATVTIVGSLRDAQGGVVPNAMLTLTSETRGTTFSGTTSSTGDFIFPNIPGDTYTVSVSLTGFKKSGAHGHRGGSPAAAWLFPPSPLKWVT